MATFIWTLWGFQERSCFMRNHYMIITRLAWVGFTSLSRMLCFSFLTNFPDSPTLQSTGTLFFFFFLTCSALVQFWCSYMTVPLNVIVSQMGSRCKKALVAESVRKSLHSWCKRVKHKSKHDSLHSHTTRSVCSLESTIDERDEITVVSGTLTRSSYLESLNQITVTVDQLNLI
ncbi:hypothetical protein AAZX31_12G159000 [Glycine max]